jgi:hypothetical protein
MTTPVLTNFVVAPRVYGTVPFNLTDPTSSPSGGIFTFTSSNTDVATISGREVTILKSGNTTITATRGVEAGFLSASITALFTVNIATPTLSNFTIPNKSFSDVSFALTNPTSNSPGVFSFISLTPLIVAVSGNIATLKGLGRATIRASQFPATNYNGNASIDVSFDVLSGIVRVGTPNEIDLSWNTPVNNGATVKNYFFSVEERVSTTVPAPPVTTIVSTVAPRVSSYYSYALPVPYSAQIISPNTQLPTGIDINSTIGPYKITTLPAFTQKNQIDLGYYSEIEISWVYHNDRPIEPLKPGNASTTMTLSLIKEASVVAGDNTISLLRSIQRNYDSGVNCLGPRPQNNNKTMTDVFTVDFDTGFDSGAGGTATVDRALKYLKSTDIVSGSVQFSSLSYSPLSGADASYSIILQSIRIIPYRLPITREFTSLGLGATAGGIAEPGVGFTVSTVNAMALSDVSGILYHMPKMTRSLTDFNEAKWTFSWNYGANITKLATDISFLPIPIRSGSTVQNIEDLNIPFRLRIRGYSRPYSSASTSTDVVASYNTTDVPAFLTNIGNSLYYTRLLFDRSLNLSASYAEIVGATSESITIDISGASGFPAFTDSFDTSHTQFVFLFQLSITDASYNAYFRSIAGAGTGAATNAFRVNMLSQTFTPRQEYRFGGPDPTLESSNAQSSATNTVYSLSNPYTNITPYYRFFDLSNGVFYSYKIASNNRAGTSAFSDAFTRRCGSVPNQIVNSIIDGQSTYKVESENQVNIYWLKPVFSGYEITKFVIEMAIDPTGRWLNFIEYTRDLSQNQITFGGFQDVIVPVTIQSKQDYYQRITTYTLTSTGASGPLINGRKYYFRLGSVNELGYSMYSTILSGVVFARPDTAPVQFGPPLVGNQLVYLTWRIPQDDAGSPILTYVIDYEEETGPNTYGETIPYRENITIPVGRNVLKDRFLNVYTRYKNYDSLTPVERANLDISRNQLLTYIIPPTAITLNDADFVLNPLESTANKNVKLTYAEPPAQATFTYISDELRQNVFDIHNIQLKWYYFNDSAGAVWPDNNTTVSFKMSIRGDLIDVSGNASLDISNIFYIPPGNVYGGGAGAYNVNPTLFSTPSNVNYIHYVTGLEIGENNETPKILIPTLPRIDSYNNRRYKLKIVYTITEMVPDTGTHRFILYSGPIVINGTAPIRTSPDMSLNTIFTYKVQHVEGVSPILNGKTYRFRITPFNLNDFFPGINRTSCTIGTSFSLPVTDMSYSLVPTSLGGKVELRWKFSQISDYNIVIMIADDHFDGNQEYPSSTVTTGERSILVRGLIPDVSNNVVYSIPSTQPNEVLNQYAQTYLKSGRAYTITIGPVKIVIDAGGNTFPLQSPITSITPTDSYVVPFSTPLRPLDFRVLGNNGSVTLRWKLPNLTSDPNYYITTVEADPPPTPELPYYRYKYYSLDMRNIAANSNSAWTSVVSELEIPSANVAESETTRVVSGLTNEHNHQFRVRLMIINNFNGQRAFSDYTYFTSINEVAVSESSGNTVYPSIYPYKPGVPSNLSVYRADNPDSPGSLNIILLSFRFPAYNGNADLYECYAEYTPPYDASGSGTVWTDIFDASVGLANRSANTLLFNGTTGGMRTALLTGSFQEQTFTITCKAAITLRYGIRIRIIGRKSSITVYPYTLFSDYSSIDYLDL